MGSRLAFLMSLLGCASCAPAAPVPAPRPLTSPRPAPPAVPAPVPAATASAIAPACPTVQVDVPEVPLGEEDPPVPRIVDAEVLARFFEKAAAVIRGRATDHVRIAYYGDSNHTMDFQTGRLRRILQSAYGDAGHGFVSFGRPWSHYQHRDVRHDMGRGWTPLACTTHPVMDHRYGIGGIAAESMSMGAQTWVETAPPEAPIGQKASHFAVYFLKGPRYGRFDIDADGETVAELDSHADAVGLGVYRFELPDGPHRIVATARDERRRVRLFGITLERNEKPSFIVDAFGVGSMNTASQAREDSDINRAMLKERGYDLIVFATGANDGFTLDQVPGHFEKLVALHREALPDAPILFVTPSDRGKTSTPSLTRKVIEQRYAIAKTHRAALWDLFAAMGGPNAMPKFYRRRMSMADHTHLNEKGGMYVGQRLTHALWRELDDYVQKAPTAGCSWPSPSPAP